jgi:WhiB family redox-sensing transcriptional regulator
VEEIKTSWTPPVSPYTATNKSGWWSASELTTDYSFLPVYEPVTTIRFDRLWPDWHEFAACRDQGYEAFFGADTEVRPALTIRQVKSAQDVCAVCPVFANCLEQALFNNEEYGIWAGTTGRTRRRIQKMVSDGETTYATVIEDYLNGRKAPYERGGTRRRRRESTTAGVPAEDGGAIAG